MTPRFLAAFTILFALAFTEIGADERRGLTFDDRVRAQERIERVYFAHQNGAVVPFEEAVPRPVIVGKVTDYLKKNVALEKYWQTTITADALDRELDRMARGSRMPERLQELFSALGGDPFLIRECLARPSLVDRLARQFFKEDRTLHEGEMSAAAAVRARLIRGEIETSAGTVTEYVVRDTSGNVGVESSLSMRVELSADDFAAMAGRFPGPLGKPGPVIEDVDSYAIGVPLARSGHALRVAIFTSPRTSWDEWWSRTSRALDETSVPVVATADPLLPASTGAGACTADDQWVNGTLDDVPDPRYGASAVWTGTEMLVWGGAGGVYDVSGGRYDPAIDTWQPISRIGAPSRRERFTAAWTGSAMIIWGGLGTVSSGPSGFKEVNTGSRYDPVSDTWTSMATLSTLHVRMEHTAVWTGTQMVIWGGSYQDATGHFWALCDGAKYDPAHDTWSAMSSPVTSACRSRHAAVWTGTKMIVWGGTDGGSGTGNSLNTGGQYDPSTDVWTPTTTQSAPGGVATAVWTGRLMIVWGSLSTSSGATYDPSLDRWQATSTTGMPQGVSGHTAVWTGTEMVVWGGSNFTQDVNTGARYNPVTNTWAAMSSTNAPIARDGHVAAWTGGLMVVWGGKGNSAVRENTGGRYDPASNSWTPTSTGPAPRPRWSAASVWTGTQMVVWGGYDGVARVRSGGRYDPATDSWLPTSLVGVPSARNGHTAVWTGQRMVISGGSDGVNPIAGGGRYDPVGDAWTATSTTNAIGRYDHSAVWTGTAMLVWGGFVKALDGSQTTSNTGERYDPIANVWVPISTLNAPAPRAFHGGVWTGNRMLVWGGPIGDNTGGLYDPTADAWTPTSTLTAPVLDQAPSMVWAGTQAVVWGTTNSNNQVAGGRYDPGTDTWRPASVTNAPFPDGQAIWTGDRMLVWGADPNGTGGRYDPVGNVWTGITSLAAPTAKRSFYASVWTGQQMIVLGGQNIQGGPLSSGGGYCACRFATYYADADGDGHGDPVISVESCAQPAGYVPDGTDCNDSSAQSWGAPTEVMNLLLTDSSALQWDSPSTPGATTVLYDVVRTTNVRDFVNGAICIATDTGSLATTDIDMPAPGKIYFYLVRAQNSCPNGSGPLGYSSDGTPRTGLDCP